MASNLPAAPNPGPSGEFILYQTEDGRTKLQVRVEDQTVWLTQRLIAELFQVTSQNVTQHLRTIYSEGELDVGATCKKILQVQSEGEWQVTRLADHYNLDAILGRKDEP